ncbi:nucleotidyl transferase AbiEii/AbiGii toxin family protein [Patescibacteria group bacterium]|nr:nucleotidyl transferase AbiEii/AbiGii toxin family protein [Patescibacteria group bacterium]
MSILYTKTLDKIREEVFQKLSNFADEFILAGDTAIMLLINHRKSFDFDCFSEKPLDKKLLPKAKQIFGNDINVQVDNPDSLLFTTPEGVKVDFVYFPYPSTYDLIKKGSIPMFNLRDLASNKAYAIGRRATWRDYVDMFFLIKKFGVGTIIKDSQKKFGGEFSEKLFLEQLVYYKDLEITPIEFVEKTHTPKKIQDFLQNKVHEYTLIKINGQT